MKDETCHYLASLERDDGGGADRHDFLLVLLLRRFLFGLFLLVATFAHSRLGHRYLGVVLHAPAADEAGVTYHSQEPVGTAREKEE